jgi:protease-4
LELTSRLAPLKLRPLRTPRALAVVPLSGTIASGRSRNAPGMGAVLGSETAVAALAAARQDRRCPSALVTIDSRGGSALASEIVWRELTRLSAEKPTVVYVDSVAASGGYLIACGAPRILAAPRAIVGSIGVFSGHFDLSGLLNRLGIHQEFVGRGARAGLARTGELNDGEWQAIEALADDVYAAFIQLVADARKKSVEAVREVAQGKVFSGAEAARLGLVDRTCGHGEALLEAKLAGNLSPEVEPRLFGETSGAALGELLARLS